MQQRGGRSRRGGGGGWPAPPAPVVVRDGSPSSPDDDAAASAYSAAAAASPPRHYALRRRTGDRRRRGGATLIALSLVAATLLLVAAPSHLRLDPPGSRSGREHRGGDGDDVPALLLGKDGAGAAEGGRRRCVPPSAGEPPRNDVVVVVTCNRLQASRAASTVRGLRTRGSYSGDVVVLHSSSDLPVTDAVPIFRDLNVEFKSFPRGIIEEGSYVVPPDLPGHGPKGRGYNQTTAWIYFFKFHVLDPFFAERWCRVLYVDSGVRTNGNVGEYLDSIYPTDKLYAPADHDREEGTFNLGGQFVGAEECPSYSTSKADLASKFDLNVSPYPRSAVLYFNTETVIRDDPNVVERLYELQRQYPVGLTLDQAYFALYYASIKKIWEVPPPMGAGGRRRLFDYCHNLKDGGANSLLSKRDCFEGSRKGITKFQIQLPEGFAFGKDAKAKKSSPSEECQGSDVVAHNSQSLVGSAEFFARG